jgi:hypothetical protein
MVSVFDQLVASRAKRALGVGAVAFAQVALLLTAYRARVLTHGALWSSDVFVFAVPSLLALVGYLLLLRSGRTSWMLPVGVSIGFTFLALLLSLIIAFNTYGT